MGRYTEEKHKALSQLMDNPHGKIKMGNVKGTLVREGLIEITPEAISITGKGRVVYWLHLLSLDERELVLRICKLANLNVANIAMLPGITQKDIQMLLAYDLAEVVVCENDPNFNGVGATGELLAIQSGLLDHFRTLLRRSNVHTA